MGVVMPYVTQQSKDVVDPYLNPMLEKLKEWHTGCVAYVVYRIGLTWTCQAGFSRMALFLGVLVCVILELYRRVLGPYEDNKIVENGDVTE